MRNLVLHTLFAGALAVVSFSTTGCLEQKIEVAPQANGSGKLLFSRTIGQQMASFMLMDPEGPNNAAVEALAGWKGIDAWTDIAAAKTDDGRLKISATGWFSDLSKVALTSEKSNTKFVYESEGTTARVGVDSEQVEEAEGEEDPMGEMGLAAVPARCSTARPSRRP